MSDSERRPQNTIPSRKPDLLTRQRLIELLEEMVDRRLILVSAPAGYGKTSLLVDFAQDTDLPVAWHALDELDRDPRRFFLDLLSAIQETFPKFGVQTRAYLDAQPDADLDVSLVCTQFAREVQTVIGEHFLLVLDDFQLVEDTDEILDFVNQFVQEVSENCHLVIASRTLPALPDLPLLVARREVGGIGFEDLAFRAAEIRDLVFLTSRHLLEDHVAEALAEATEGWVTGLILSTWPELEEDPDRIRLARVSGLGLFDFLARQVLEHQPPEVRLFLLRTALLGEFNDDVCRAVYGTDQDWNSQIRDVLRRNLFLNSLGGSKATFRYHRLFEEFLRQILWQERPEEARASLQRLGHYHLSRAQWESAHQAVERIGDPVELGELICAAGTALARAGRLGLLAVWLNDLPERVRRADPELTSLEGIVKSMMGQTEEGLALLDRAVAEFRSANLQGPLTQALLRRTYARRFVGHIARAMEDALEVIGLTAGGSDAEQLLVRAEAFHAFGICKGMLGEYEQAIGELDRAADIYTRVGDPTKVAMLQIDRGFAHHRAGNYRDGLREYQKSLRFWQGQGNLVHQATLQNNIGVLYHALGDYQQALLIFEKAVETSRQSGYRRMEALSLAGIGDLYTDLEVAEAALDAYHQSRDIAQQIGFEFLEFYLDLAEAVHAQRNGDLALAEELRGLAARRVAVSENPYNTGYYHLQAGRTFWIASDHAAATAELMSAIEYLESINQQPELLIARLILAHSLHVQGKPDERDAQIEVILRSGAAPRHRHSLIVHGNQLGDLLDAVEFEDPRLSGLLADLRAGIAAFQEELPERRRMLRPVGITIPLSPPLLDVRALGLIEVQVAGEAIGTKEWGTQASRDMLFCLLAHPSGLSKEALAGNFWPDLAPDKVNTRFKNTIYRMRRALDQPVAIRQNERYRFNWELDYSYDVEAFERALAKAKRSSATMSSIQHLEEALDSYGGQYLPGLGYSWVYAERQQLQADFIRAALDLGELYLEASRGQDALGCAFQIFEVEPTHEGACRLAMKAHDRLGNRPAVARQFQQCRERMWDEYQLDLSPQTIELYERLTQS